MKILIAEDDTALLDALGSKFRSEGFETVTCADGSACLERMREDKVDGIILDLLMPEKDGYDVLSERGSTKNAETPVYVVTNLGREEDCERAKALGAKVCYVKSNVSLKEVIEFVKSDLKA